MFRSFLARPHPQLSHLRLHDCRFAAKLGRRGDAISSRGYYTSSEDETDTDIDRPDAKPVSYGRTSHSPDHTKKHLYVVLDDWKKGFSIHKLDLDDSSDGGDLTQRVPVHRQTMGDPYWNFDAVGSKIIAAGRIKSSWRMLSEEDDYATLVYETETAGLSIVPRLPGTPYGYRWDVATVAGNGLYTFKVNQNYMENGQQKVGMHHLKEALPPTTGHGAYWWGTSDHWSWSSISSPVPYPASRMGMASIAVHPDGGGRNLFVSLGEWHDPHRGTSEAPKSHTGHTYSYNVASGEWSDHGKWSLPCLGQAHYDSELEAWVGLHKKLQCNGLSRVDGCICSCDLVSPTGSLREPDWKVCMDRFNLDTEGATLVYMGESTYCLVEVVEREGFKTRRCAGPSNKCMIRLSKFRLKYDKKGDLTITARQPERFYHFPRYIRPRSVTVFLQGLTRI